MARHASGNAMRPLRGDYNPAMDAAKHFRDVLRLAGHGAAAAAALGLAACSSASPPPAAPAPAPVAVAPPPPPPPPPPERLPDAFESKDFVLAIARPGDTVESLAGRYLGAPEKSWMITDYGARAPLAPGQRVAIPRRDWNTVGVDASGYQVVPVLAYAATSGVGRRRPAPIARAFAEQMRHLKSAGYQPVGLADFIAFLQHRRQLPRKAVLITFDEAQRELLESAVPVLRELGFPAVVFASTGAVAARPGGASLTWAELRDLAGRGVDVQAQSRTLRDLRRGSGESEDTYSRRMQQELEPPVELLRRNVPRLPGGLETLAYPGGNWNEDVTRYARQYGYGAAFGLGGEPNPAFVPMFQISRTAVPPDWTLDDFKRSLITFHEQPIAPGRTAMGPHWSPPIGEGATRRAVAAPHREWSAQLEQRGLLREALEECAFAAAIEPDDAATSGRCAELQAKIASEEARLVREGTALARAGNPGARNRFLAALALNPASAPAFDALRTAPPAVRFLRHTVGPRDTPASLADLYYGDRKRADVIEQANDLGPGAALTVGQVLRIPEIKGVPFLRPDR